MPSAYTILAAVLLLIIGLAAATIIFRMAEAGIPLPLCISVVTVAGTTIAWPLLPRRR